MSFIAERAALSAALLKFKAELIALQIRDLATQVSNLEC